MTGMRLWVEVAAGLAVGALAAVGWGSAEPSSAQTAPAAPLASPPTAPAPAADGCPDNEDERAAVAALERTWQEASDRFERRWGEPLVPPGSLDPVRRERELTDTLSRVEGATWATADCSEWPCIGLVLHEGYLDQDEVTAQVGMPDAPTWGSNLPALDDVWVDGIGFYEGDLTERQRFWIMELYVRLLLRRQAEMAVVASGDELAEPP